MSVAPQTSQEARLESRYQDLVAQFYVAQASLHNSEGEGDRLRTVMNSKQELIEELLSYYPYPLSDLMQAKIYLT